MKPQIIKALAAALGLYELGLSYWLHSIDHPTWVPEQEECPYLTFGCVIMGHYVPPPWYANLWPEALALGLALLIVPWVREIPQAIKAAYRKWEEWDSGGRRF